MPGSPVALITGAARGIGAAVAVALAKEGYDLAILGASDPAGTIAKIEAAGRRAVAVVGDVARAGDREKALAALDEAYGRVDLLVNNAGVAPKVRTDILEATEESYDRVMGINLKGPYFLTQAVARRMLQRRREGYGGWMCIINISSVSAYAASTARGEYCLSKAGVSMATKLWAARLAEANVGVYEIRPGVIATDMTAPVKDKYDKLIAGGLTPIRRWGTGDDVARAVTACARGLLPFSTGEVINVDGGFHLRTL